MRQVVLVIPASLVFAVIVGVYFCLKKLCCIKHVPSRRQISNQNYGPQTNEECTIDMGTEYRAQPGHLAPPPSYDEAVKNKSPSSSSCDPPHPTSNQPKK